MVCHKWLCIHICSLRWVKAGETVPFGIVPYNTLYNISYKKFRYGMKNLVTQFSILYPFGKMSNTVSPKLVRWEIFIVSFFHSQIVVWVVEGRSRFLIFRPQGLSETLSSICVIYTASGSIFWFRTTASWDVSSPLFYRVPLSVHFLKKKMHFRGHVLSFLITDIVLNTSVLLEWFQNNINKLTGATV